MVSRHAGRDEKIRVVKVLRVLNYFYSLRDLEKILGVPFQSLWKYVNMIALPSDEVAAQIVSKIQQLNLLEDLLLEVTKRGRENPRLLSIDIGFAFLFTTILVNKLGKPDIDYVLSASVDSIPMATVLALELGAELCTPLSNTGLGDGTTRFLWFYSSTSRSYQYLVLPRKCLSQGKKVFAVDLIADDTDRIQAIASTLRHHNVDIVGFAAVFIDETVLKKLAELGIKNVYYTDVTPGKKTA